MASSDKPTFGKVFRKELPAILGGFGGFGLLHLGVWRWPQVRALFGNDEEWFLTATVGLAVGAAWLYMKVAGARVRRTLESLEADDLTDERPGDGG